MRFYGPKAKRRFILCSFIPATDRALEIVHLTTGLFAPTSAICYEWVLIFTHTALGPLIKHVFRRQEGEQELPQRQARTGASPCGSDGP